MAINLKKHSSLGIIAFVIGILITIGLCLILFYALIDTSDGFLVNTISILLGLLALVGVILGIIGTVQKEPKKIFAIIGLVLNGLVLLFLSWGWISAILLM